MITLDLPLPPSANRIWRYVPGSTRTALSEAYQNWTRAADQFAVYQLSSWTRGDDRLPIEGPFAVTITLDRKRHGKGDPDNRIKPALDYLQRAGVVANDKHLERLLLEYGEAPEGMRLITEPPSPLGHLIRLLPRLTENERSELLAELVKMTAEAAA